MKKIFLVALIYLVFRAEVVLSQVPFYQDKTISVVLGGPPAGSADMRTRAVTTILRKHIPGKSHHHRPIYGSRGRAAGGQPYL